MEHDEANDDTETEEDCEIELVVQGRTIEVSEQLLCQNSLYFRQVPFVAKSKFFNFNIWWIRKVFQDVDDEQETIILKHTNIAGEDIPEEKQQEPLSQIRSW